MKAKHDMTKPIEIHAEHDAEYGNICFMPEFRRWFKANDTTLDEVVKGIESKGYAVNVVRTHFTHLTTDCI